MPHGRPCARVIGVVEDIRDAPNGGDPPMRFYVPAGQIGDAPTVIIVRTDAADAPAMATRIRASLPATQRATIEVIADRVARALRPWHTATLLFIVLGGVALALACVGVYSVMSCIAAERTRELGIRVVLGATTGDIMRLVFTQGLRLTLTGGAVGVIVAAGSGQLLGSLLFDVSRFDPAIYGLGLLSLAAAGFCAILPPALRASRVNPVTAIRGD
jgi:ABC-type antimicrobial peptide transport system permease subunit